MLKSAGRQVDAVVDSDEAKHGKILEGFTVESPGRIRQSDTVIVASAWAGDIIRTLHAAGCYYHECTPLWWSLTTPETVVHWPMIRRVAAHLATSKDRDTYLRVISAWISHDLAILPKSEEAQRRNALTNLFSGCTQILDGGAYDGKDATHWLVATTASRVICVDPIPRPALLEAAVEDPRILVYEAALGPEEGTCEISEAGSTTRVVGQWERSPLGSTQPCPCRRLDSWPEVDAVKLDIEGAELNTLLAAREWLSRSKPQLAISIYHRMSDLWTIPTLLMELYPHARFTVRHWSQAIPETMLLVDQRRGS
jgi:FkbM family methyltransferase